MITDMKKMKWLLSTVAAMAAAVSCGQKAEAPKVLVLYYSQSSNTEALAEEIAGRLGADLEEIVPTVPYDGTYDETIRRSSLERESGKLPEIQPLNASVADYDIIFIGYPVWYGTYALPVASLLEQVDFSGKRIVPFCTFGSGGIDSSSKDMAAKLSDAEILPGYGVRAARMDAMPGEVDRFLKENGYLEGEYVKLEAFPESHPVTEEESAVFDAAVGDYPMIHARAASVASRSIPGGTEYLFTAVDLPREGAPQAEPRELKVYVTAEEGKDPVFTQVIR